MSNKKLKEFNIKFDVENLIIYNTGIWTWSLRPNQVTLGSSIISLNRYALKLSDVTEEEMSDLAKLISIVEPTINSSFNHNIMNYLMLMMVDHHVHYHVIPRYDDIRQFDGLDWVDNGWPALPVMGDNQHESKNNLKKIQETLINSIK